MKATHTVKIDGVYYRAGDNLPDKTKSEPENKPKYTKSDILTMKVADLRELAANSGIENPEEFTGSELKAKLCEKLGL